MGNCYDTIRVPLFRGGVMSTIILILGIIIGFWCQTAVATPILFGDGQDIYAEGIFGATGSIYDYRVYGTSMSGDLRFDVSYSNPEEDALIVRYSLSASSELTEIKFFAYLDAEIDETNTTYWNERGEVIAGNGGADSWEIDEPGYFFIGDLLSHFSKGELDNLVFNGSSLTVDDVAFGLGFNIGTLTAGLRLDVELVISERELSTLKWGTVLHQWDDDLGADGDQLYFAGKYMIAQTTIPEPSTGMMLLIGVVYVFSLVIIPKMPAREQ